MLGKIETRQKKRTYIILRNTHLERPNRFAFNKSNTLDC